MKKLIYPIMALVLGLCFTSVHAQTVLFDIALANQTEAEAFVTTLPANFSGTNIEAAQWGGTWGVRFLQNSSLEYTATGLTAGEYTMEGIFMVQNTAVLPWTQDVWASGGTAPTPAAPSEGTNGTFVTISKTVTVPSDGDYVFGIVKGNHGSQLILQEWSVTRNPDGVSSANDITEFSFAEEIGVANIDAEAHTVSINVPVGTDMTALTPTITVSDGATIDPLSGVEQNFTSDVVYTVTAEDDTEQEWTVSVSVIEPTVGFEVVLANQTEAEAFVAALPANFAGTNIEAAQWGGTWGVRFLQNSSLEFTATALTAGDYTMEGIFMVQNTAVLPWTQGVWASGETAPTPAAPSEGTNGTFVTISKIVTVPSDGDYIFGIVKGNHGSQLIMQEWSVTKNSGGLSSETDITAFSLTEETGVANIDTEAHTVTIEVANGTDVTDLTPTITVSDGAAIDPLSGVEQNFTSDVVYTVTAEDDTEQEWTITVTEEIILSSANDITAFSLTEETGAANIDTEAHTVTIEVANGTDITALTPTITVSDGAAIDPLSGVEQNFTSDVVYTVTAEDDTEQEWTVTVTEEIVLSSANDITAFSLTEETGAANIDTEAHTVTIEVANGTDVTDLTPTITVSDGAAIDPLSGVEQNFTSDVVYTVTAEDNSEQEWTVTVTEEIILSSANDITAFSLTEETGAANIDTDAHTLTIEVANGTDVTALTPTITVSDGAAIDPLSGVEQNFTSDVVYTVIAEDDTEQEWTVTVTEEIILSSANDITAFSLTEETGVANIDTDEHTITIEVANGTDVTALTPTITISDGATIDPLSGVEQNFTSDVVYTVIAEDDTEQEWTVTVTEAPGLLVYENRPSIVNVYPNPAAEVVNIDLVSLKDNTSISVISATGSKVFEQTNISDTHMVISNLKSGIYLIQINTANNRIVRKIVVE